MNQPIDEDYIEDRVRDLQAQGFPATEGHYLVVVSPADAFELVVRLGARPRTKRRLYGHSSLGLVATAENLGYGFVCVLGNAVVVSADHANPHVTRRSKQPPLRLVRWQE